MCLINNKDFTVRVYDILYILMTWFSLDGIFFNPYEKNLLQYSMYQIQISYFVIRIPNTKTPTPIIHQLY